MYDCDKGFILGERGPPGATCVGGLWRPTELPSCLPGLHPRLRWNRRKRSLQMRSHRSQFLLRNIRQVQRKYAELLYDMHTGPDELLLNKQTIRKGCTEPVSNGLLNNNMANSAYRRKCSFNVQRTHRRKPFVRASFMQRVQRNRDNVGVSGYDRYFQLLKQNHIDYINAMFRINQDLNNNNISTEKFHQYPGSSFDHPFYNLKGRLPTKVEIRKDVIIGNELIPNKFNEHEQYFLDSHEQGNSHIRQFNLFPIPFPNINENLNEPQTKKLDLNTPFINNTYADRKTWNFSRDNLAKNLQRPKLNRATDFPRTESDAPESDIITRLKSQTFRRKKRNTDEDLSSETLPESEVRPGRRRKFNQTMYDTDDNSENGRKGKSKEPCEVK